MEQVESWSEGIAAFHARFARHFGRSEPRERALDYLTGLLAPLEKKNAWTMAEQVGQLRPDGVQRLLNHSEWDENAVRDVEAVKGAPRTTNKTSYPSASRRSAD